jgi:hypothetical protein
MATMELPENNDELAAEARATSALQALVPESFAERKRVFSALLRALDDERPAGS